MATLIRIHRHRALIAGAATLAPVVVWVPARIAGADFKVHMSGQPPMGITLPLVLVTALLAALAGWALLAILERFTGRARMMWTGAALMALVASFVPVATVETAGGVRLTLALMHLAVAVVLIPGLRATTIRSTADPVADTPDVTPAPVDQL